MHLTVRLQNLNKTIHMIDVLIIGAGPIGLAVAARLANTAYSFSILEKGPRVGNNVLDWGHVELFTSWEESTDPMAMSLLKKENKNSQFGEGCPTAQQFVNQYLEEVASLEQIKTNLIFQAEVVSVSTKTEKPSSTFEVEYNQLDVPKKIEAKVVVDASGTWGNFNHISDLETINKKIYYGIPSEEDITDSFQEKNLAVVGNGHSAMNTLLSLSQYSQANIDWIIRGPNPKFGVSKVGGRSNQLETKVKNLIESSRIGSVRNYNIQSINNSEKGLVLHSDKGIVRGPYLHIIANTGAKPDFDMLENIPLNIDSRFLTASSLANKIDPKLHSCDTVSYKFTDTILSDQNYFVVGMKSFGRASNFYFLLDTKFWMN